MLTQGSNKMILKVFAIYPAFNVEVNEMAILWRALCAAKPVQCTILAGKNDPLKGHCAQISYEHHLNLDVHRYIWPLRIKSDILSLVRQNRPNLIFCAVATNMPAALAIKKIFNVPIVLHSEHFLDNTMMVRRRYHLEINLLRIVLNEIYRRWLAQHTNLILCSNPREFESSDYKRYPTLHYLPWPHPYQGHILLFEQRDKNLSVYIGSISLAKGADILCCYYSYLLRKCPEFKLVIVGPVLDKVGEKALQALKEVGRERVILKSNCSRAEALDLIRRSLFVLSPGKRLGWGLIGDAWVAGTPVLAVKEHYDLKAEKNCWIVRCTPEFGDAVAALQSDASRWRQLSMGGVQTATTLHSIDIAVNTLFDRLCEVADQSSVGRHSF